MNKCLIFILFLVVQACNPAIVFEKYEELPEEVWNRYRIVEFHCNIPDSGLYDIKLCVRHTTDFETANLWCYINTRSHAPWQLEDTVNIKIADSDGRWTGRGATLKTVEQMIGRNPVILPKGSVLFRITPGMPGEQTPGIKNIGLKIIRK